MAYLSTFVSDSFLVTCVLLALWVAMVTPTPHTLHQTVIMTPVIKPMEDTRFLECVASGECGIENKCAFKLKSTGTASGSSSSSSSSGTPQPGGQTTGDGGTTTQPSIPTTTPSSGTFIVTGHIVALKNRMPYDIVYFWDIMGYDVPINHDPSERFHKSHVKAHSVNYVDTKFFAEHTVRLYVSTTGNSTETLMETPTDAHTLEFVQTFLVSDEQCSPYQACRLLDSVCYMAGADDKDCMRYKLACTSLDDVDGIARMACIPECVHTYWADKIAEDIEIDSDGVIRCMQVGCGIKNSGVDGKCNTSVIIALSMVVVILVFILLFTIVVLYSNRRNLKTLVDQTVFFTPGTIPRTRSDYDHQSDESL